MEASTAQPAEAAPEQQGQQPAPEETTQPTNAELAEQMRVLEQKLAPAEPEAEPVADLATAFGQGDEEELADEEYGEEDFGLYDDQGQIDPAIAQLLQRQQGVEDYLIGEAERRNATALAALGEKYPDLKNKEMVDRVQAEIQDLADEMGNPDLAQNPPARLVERVFKSLKADEESANETPAEEAVTQGASLETGAGPGNQAEDTSPQDEYGDRIVAASKRGKSAFT